jgi:hypothetical protein
VVFGNYLYVIGSDSGRMAINDDGTLGPWAPVSVTGKQTLGGFRLAVVGNYIYSLDGYNSSGSSLAVEQGTVAADGSITFTTNGIPQMDRSRERGASAVLGYNLMVFDGYESGGGTTPAPIRIAISPSSLALTSATAFNGWLAPDFDPAIMVVGPTLYLVSGQYTSTRVRSCSVSDTTLTVQNSVTTQMSRGLAGLVVTISHAYLMGGDLRYPVNVEVEAAALN